jgi:hypothetical protein
MYNRTDEIRSVAFPTLTDDEITFLRPTQRERLLHDCALGGRDGEGVALLGA